jgi:hypothetical protein
VIILTLIALVGATLIVVRGKIFRPLRRLSPSFFGCSQCFGTWVGAAAGATGIVVTGHGRALDMIVVGCATSYLSMLADAVFINLLGDPLDDNEEEKHHE